MAEKLEVEQIQYLVAFHKIGGLVVVQSKEGNVFAVCYPFFEEDKAKRFIETMSKMNDSTGLLFKRVVS